MKTMRDESEGPTMEGGEQMIMELRYWRLAGWKSSSSLSLSSLLLLDLRLGGLTLVLESPVQSGFLAQKNKTETETGPDVS